MRDPPARDAGGAAAFGLAAFSIAMAAGRLAGDAVSARLGTTTHIRASLAGAGLLLAALAIALGGLCAVAVALTGKPVEPAT